MTEAQFSLKLRKAIQARLPDAIIWKIADQFTAGLPDFVVVLNGIATWFEHKMYTNKRLFEPIQYENLRRLKRGYYIFWGTTQGIVFYVWKTPILMKTDVAGHPTVLFDTLVDNIIEICKN